MVNFAYLIGDRDDGRGGDRRPRLRRRRPARRGRRRRHAGGRRPRAPTTTPTTSAGRSWATPVEGVRELLEPPSRARSTSTAPRPSSSAQDHGLAASDLVSHDGGDVIEVGRGRRSSWSTRPGTRRAASASWSTAGWWRATRLFLEGCGRTDLPGSDPAAMYESLHRLASLPDDVVVYPGHRYSVPRSAPWPPSRRPTTCSSPAAREEWLAMFGQVSSSTMARRGPVTG